MPDEAASSSKKDEDFKEKLHKAEDEFEALKKEKIEAVELEYAHLASLLKSEYPCRFLIEKMSEGFVIISLKGTILYANPGFYKMVDNHKEKGGNVSFLNFVDKDDQANFTEFFMKPSSKKANFNLITTNNQTLTVSIMVDKGTWEGDETYCLLLTDITYLKRIQHLIEASESITKIFGETPNLSMALKHLIAVLKNTLGWEALFLWTWNKEKHSLCCSEMACIPEINIDEFIKITMQSPFKETQMASRVWATYRPCWIEDVTKDAHFLRCKQAMQNNIHGALAFPFYEESHLAGVIELFRREPYKEAPDDLILNLLTTIGIELGLYTQRKIDEEVKLFYSAILACSPSAIFTTTVDGVVKSWSSGASKIYGWTEEEIIGKTIKKLVPSDRLSEYDKVRASLRRGITIENFQTQFLHKNGTLVWVDLECGFITDSHGNTIGICCIAQDISVQMAVLKSVTESEERLKGFVETTGELVWETDKEGACIFCNSAMYKILGYQVEEALGQKLDFFSFAEDKNVANNMVKSSIAQKQGWVQKILRLKHKDGTERWLESNATVILDDHHEVLGLRGASRDITEFRALDKIKNEFISMVSHELRSPLTSILGAISLMTTKTFTHEEGNILLTTAKKNAEKLAHLINDIMDVEKLQLGKFEYTFKKINMRDVIKDAINSSAIIANKFNIQIVTKEMACDAEVYGDFIRLGQVMTNLLSNAIKLSPVNAAIYVSLESHEAVIRVSVTDQGPGIPESFRPKIFETFAQADSSSKRTYQGSGLGLSISKNIVEGHGGTINFITEMGKGTTFFFELPKYKGQACAKI